MRQICTAITWTYVLAVYFNQLHCKSSRKGLINMAFIFNCFESLILCGIFLWVNYVWKFLYKHFKETLITCVFCSWGQLSVSSSFFFSFVTLFYLLFCIHLVYYKVCPWLVKFNVFQLPFSHGQTLTRFYSSQDINDIDLFEIGGTVSFQLTKTKSRGDYAIPSAPTFG